jgi:hypothetical protein
MENKPKGRALPLIAAGGLMVLCCAAPVIFGSAAIAALGAWFGGFGIGNTVALAGFAVLIVCGIIRFRKSLAGAGDGAPTHITDESGPAGTNHSQK